MQKNNIKIDKKTQNIIDTLVRVYKKPSFSAEFDHLTASLNTQKKFFIKQELARLFKPFERTIDMSRESKYKVSEFSWNGKRFFLDDIGRRIFLLELDKFGEQYTAGVFEAVNNAEIYARFEKQFLYEQKIKEFEVQITELGRTTKRLEERLYCAKPIKIIRQAGEPIDAVTSNISRSGCLLRVKPYAILQQNEIFEIDFSALTSQFAFDKQPKACYQVKFLSPTPDKDGAQRVGVQLIDKNYEWTQFLDKYVLENRSSFKVDITNAKDLAETRLLEDHLLETSNWLMVFANADENKLKQLKYVLTNPANKNQHDFFVDGQNINRLNGVLLRLWPQLTEKSTPIVVVRFEQKGEIHFLAATLKQLIDNDLLKAFCLFANKKGLLQLFMLRKQSIDQRQLDEIKFNWFKSAKEADQALQPLTEINQIISLYPLDQQTSAFELFGEHTLKPDDLKKLSAFRCPSIKNHVIGHFDIRPKCARQEMRYFYSTAVTLTIPENKQAINGNLIDLSVSGLSVQLPAQLPAIADTLEVAKVLAVTIPKFDQFGERNAIHNAFYKIVGINRRSKTLHFQVYNSDQSDLIRHFMRQLIQNNRAKLNINDQYDKFVILQKALCVAFITNYPSIAFGISKSPKKIFEVSRLLTSDFNSVELASLQKLQSPIQNQHISVFQLIYDDKRNPPYLRSISRFVRNKGSCDDEVAFQLIPNRVDIAKQARAGANPRLQNQFIRKALQTDTLKVFNLKIQPVAHNSTQAIEEQLAYVSRYNRHQAENIKSFASKLTGILEVLDNQAFWQTLGSYDINQKDKAKN
ncbi:PilZ domain-containing protein [Catenovulum sediminis]|uniref:PilZ domain-containing protein n=1 Tax=Catenovulum sediminis TaxID=1740262 RepID=A0ABV1RCF8_9ALTE